MCEKMLLDILNKYQLQHPKENIQKLIDFINSNENPFTRNNLKGHITCSTWIVNDSIDKVLLIHHKKYDKWLQPGGHMEKGESIHDAALREGLEETGVNNLLFIDDGIFDIDIHKIPENKTKGEPEHYHYDLRFITKVVGTKINIQINEVNGYKWESIDKFLNSKDKSLSRMALKSKKY